jgi:hypothetical protein
MSIEISSAVSSIPSLIDPEIISLFLILTKRFSNFLESPFTHFAVVTGSAASIALF